MISISKKCLDKPKKQNNNKIDSLNLSLFSAHNY